MHSTIEREKSKSPIVTKRKDKVILILLWLHIGLICAAAYGYRVNPVYLLPAIPLAAAATLLYRFKYAHEWYKYISLLVFIFATAFFIYASSGRIEMHFHLYFVLALFSVYLDWRVVGSGGAAYILLHMIGFFAYILGRPVPYHIIHASDLDSMYLFGLHLLAISSVSAALIYLCINGKRMLEEIIRSEREIALQRLGQQEHLAAVGQIAASIAHEIRNPLTSINGFIHLLSETNVRKDISYYQIIQDEIKRIDDLIREVLLLSKSHKLEGKFEHIHLNDVLQRTMLLIEPVGVKHNINVKLTMQESIFVEGIEDKLAQVFLNLLRNAVEAIGSNGEIEITLRPDDRYAIIEVADDGPGVQEESLDNLFVPFYTTKEKGTGLGLSVCKTIIESHYGQIEAVRNQPTGLIFRISIPRLYK